MEQALFDDLVQSLKEAKRAIDRLAVTKGESVSIRIEEGRL